MTDKYSTFDQLKKNEPAGSFRVVLEPTDAKLAIVAPHAGGIEPGISEISRLIADGIFSLYLFEGLKKDGNGDLHITSTRFDEPKCLSLLKAVDVVLTVHGEDAKDEAIVFLGGRHEQLKQALRTKLKAGGFTVKNHSSLQGMDASNICNRGRSGEGIQLELSFALRKRFFESLSREGRRKPTPQLAEFCECVGAALLEGEWDKEAAV
jgi:phage replication-related protein YjqB (UPF0714/DUF867 family)